MKSEELEKKIDKIIDSSEIVRMAGKHFDSESADMMIEELKEKLKKVMIKECLVSFLMDIDECHGMHVREQAEKCVNEYLNK